MRIDGLTLLLVLAAPALVHAQSPVYEDAMRASAALQIAAQLPATPVPLAVNPNLLAPARFSSRAPGATLMIIGGAGVLGGILVGGSGGAVLILGGIGIGAYGFYLYTR